MCVCVCRDSRSVTEGIVATVDDAKDRIHNWDILMANIKAYYRVSLPMLCIHQDLPTKVPVSIIWVVISVLAFPSYYNTEITIISSAFPPHYPYKYTHWDHTSPWGPFSLGWDEFPAKNPLHFID